MGKNCIAHNCIGHDYICHTYIGEFLSDCSCKCSAASQWTGSDCSTCSGSCSNGGKLNKATCVCECPAGHFGKHCDDYVLAQWQSLAKPNSNAKFSWHLSESTLHHKNIGDVRAPM